MADAEITEPTEPLPWVRRPTFRVLLLLGIIATFWVVGFATGAHENFSAESIRATVTSAGMLGFAAFFALFCVGQIAHIPGNAFVAAAVFAWGWWEGALVCIAAGTAGACISFLFARTVGGDLRQLRSGLLRRVLASLDRAPLRTMFLARALFMTAPPLATALALTGVRHRDHALATFLGLIPSIFFSAYTWAFGLQFFGLS